MATPSLKVTFDKNAGYFSFEDVTDWAGQGISTSDVNGNIEIIAPDGSVIYSNTLTIPTAITGTAQGGSTTNITLAAGSSSVTDYFKNYYLLATGGAGAGQSVRISAYNGTTKVATLESAVGVAFDNTTTYKFVRNDIFIEANTNNQIPIQLLYVSGTTNLVQGNYTFNYTVYDSNAAQFYTSTLGYNLSFTFPTGVLTPDVSPFGFFVKATDNTIYTVNGIAPSLSRLLTLNYPNTLNPIPSPVTSSGTYVQTATVYTGGSYGAILETTATWVMTSLVSIVGLIEDSLSIPVEIDNNLCNLQCCLRAAITRLDQLQCNGYLNEAAILRQQLILGVSYYLAVQGAIMCGSGQTKVDEYVAAFKASLNCDDECTCGNDGEPTLVIPIGSQNGTYTFTSSNGSLTVTETTVGQNTTVDYILDPTLQAAIYSSDIVVGSANIRVTATGSAPNITYTVRGTDISGGSGINITYSTSGGIVVDTLISLQNLFESNLSAALTTTTSYETLRTYTLAAGELSVNGDVLRIRAMFAVAPNNDNKSVRIQFAGNTLYSDFATNMATVSFLQMDIDCVRLSATEIGIVPTFKRLNFSGGSVGGEVGIPIYSTPYVVNNLTSSTNVINFDADSTVINDINCIFNQIEIIKS
jgi:hypothetical protein